MTAVPGFAPLDGAPRPPDGGAPLPLAEADVAEALETLEFAAVLDAVAAYATGPLGAARVRARRPVADAAWIGEELALVGEVLAWLRRGEQLLPEEVPDVGRALARLRIEGSVLEREELAAMRRLLAAVFNVDGELARLADDCPRAFALRVPLPDRRLRKRLDESVDDDGELLDSASPRLAAARATVLSARQKLVRRLEQLLRGLDPSATVPDAGVTVRGGRYVIPVRRDTRARPAGIVHDESGSAGTLFVEPQEAVELGNALREAEAEVERETLRVLRELTALLRPERERLRDALELCVRVDDLVARARYALAVEGEVPTVVPAPGALRLVAARHPLLLAQGVRVVPFALVLEAGERTLLVSGPNTGGKTVLLKAAALASLLAQSGIVPPVGPGTVLPAWRRCFADIGDRQSLAASLSTFSGHVALLRRVLDAADDGTLVLLDEVGSGTDPAEGAALAAATLLELTRRGTTTLATTHLGALKTLAAEAPGIVNGSLAFDGEMLSPTYLFRKGVPGRSYGLAIARRLGLPAAVLGDAEGRVSDAERELDRLLARAEERERELTALAAELAAEREALGTLRTQLEADRAAQDERARTLLRREKDAERRAREQARQFLLDAREKVEETLRAARAAVDEAKAREARRALEEAAKAEGAAVRRLVEEERTAATVVRPLEAGQRVRLPSGLTGDLLEVRPDGRLVVAVGAMKMVAEAAGVEPLGRRDTRRERAQAVVLDQPERTAELEIDLRGMTGDEAEAAALAAVDAAVLAEQPFLRIIHGMGTGVVRDRVRQVLQRDRRVRTFDFAPRNQGGLGVTIAEFA